MGRRPGADVKRDTVPDFFQLAEQMTDDGYLPDDALVPADDGTMTFRGFTLTATGLVPNEDASPESWDQVGDLLFRLEGALQWLIGDWLVGMERRYGVTYQQVAEKVGRDKDTLYNYVWVASRIEISRRREILFFGHHQSVAGLPPDEQDQWLDMAEVEGWSISRLRKAIRDDRPTLPKPQGYERLFDGGNKPTINRLETLFVKAGQGDAKARRDLLSQISQTRAWLDALEETLEGGE